MIIAGVLTFLICSLMSDFFNELILPKYVFEGLKIVAITALCFIVYFVLNLVFKMTYVEELVKRLKRKA